MGFKPRRDAAPHRFRARILPGTDIDEALVGRVIQLPFDPKASFGASKAPVEVRIGRGSFRSTTVSRGGLRFVPFSLKHRELTGIGDSNFADVIVSFDHEPREAKAPRDLKASLKESELTERWTLLSYSHQAEFVEAIEASRKPETRTRRIERTLKSLEKLS